MKSFLFNWERLTSDRNILQTVNGYQIEFVGKSEPNQLREPRPYKFMSKELKAFDDEIVRLLKENVIEMTNGETGQFISNIFTRPKKDGRYRIILDLSELNECIEYHYFKMDTLNTALDLITPGCYMASIDRKDTYYSVPIAESHRKFLKFRWGRRQFKALPNGLSAGPRLFTKLLKPPLATLRARGHSIVAYIDDTLIVAETKARTSQAV